MKRYKYKKIEGLQNVTPEMIDFFYDRTNKHIARVKKFGNIFLNLYEDIFINDIFDIYNFEYNISNHDESKFDYPEYIPYVLMTWQKHLRQIGENIEYLGEIDNQIIEATEHHILNNKHHPEYWSKQNENLINKENRDEIPKQIIDAINMPNCAIAEMVCDWMAMSDELGNSPYDWADKTINKRWKFNQNQIVLIYKILDNIWGKVDEEI